MAKKKHAGFIDLGDPAVETATPSKKSKPRKWYPTLSLKKSGLKRGIGQTGMALVKFKVTGIRMREDETPEFTLDLHAIKEQSRSDNAKDA